MSDFLLADDLSGALDAAAAFHAAGWRVRVALTLAAWPRGDAGEMIAFTTETRNADPASASAAVARAIAHGRATGGRLIYKKIDSTLRGPVAAELTALTREMPDAGVLFAPANPAVGRTVVDGVLLVRGIPVSETEFGRDPVSPVNESVIHRLLGDVAAERVVIADATTEADLAAAVARMDAAGNDWVGVGSGALARPIAFRRRGTGDRRQETGDRGQETGDRRQGTGDRRQGTGDKRHGDNRREVTSDTGAGASSPPAPDPCRLSPDSCLLICGSAHAANREQAAVLARVRSVALHELVPGASSTTIAAVIADIRKNRSVALAIEASRHSDSKEVVRAMAAAGAEVMAATGVRRLFVTGGETAFALCLPLGVTVLTFDAEIEPGLSLSWADTPAGRLWFAIKPGGFGDAHTWVRAWDALERIS